ncbi:phosphatase PAP2 family protein [Reinekea sp.]|jgi:membrane-associated phospholipid phosphatase|uniref:phosphatase PAP2 family protein n=1 Tax=Reinekea sp. TaxID=1970455 RepID=UPI002A80346F|nr:phosphatase PAP2 family protein [Reinekea sp.]
MANIKQLSGCLALVLTVPWVAAQDPIETAGDVLQIALPLTALAATFAEHDLAAGQALLLSYGSTFALTHLLKNTVNKERPNGRNTLSFPSGHTSSAFSGASFLAKRYGWDVGLPAYLAASFVGYSRVHAQQHDWWDVTAGAAIAIGFNQWLVPDRDELSVAVLPLRGGYQLALAFRF